MTALLQKGTTTEPRGSREAASFWLALRLSHTLRYVCAFLAGALLVGGVLLHMGRSSNAATTKTVSELRSELQQVNTRFNSYDDSCASKGSCKTFPFSRASQLVVQLAYSCFNYSAQSPPGDVTSMLSYVPGAGTTCGWQGDGSANVRTVIPNADLQLSVPAPGSNVPDPTLGIVGATVLLAGQTDPLSYVVPMVSRSGGTVVGAPGSLYTTPPNTLIRSCAPDSLVTDGEQIRQRIQYMEAGRVRSPTNDPQDYLVQGRKIARFGPSVSAITVSSLAVCQGGTDTRRNVVAHELFSGPVPGSHFDMVYGYTVAKVDGKWFVDNWGPVLNAGGL